MNEMSVGQDTVVRDGHKNGVGRAHRVARSGCAHGTSGLRLLAISCALVIAGIVACQRDATYQGRSTREWIGILDNPARSERVAAVDALGQILRRRQGSPSTEAIDALLRALKDSSDDVRLAAAAALSTEGVPPEALVPGVHEALHDTAHADVREFAARVLGTFGAARGQPAVDALTEALTDPSPRVRAAAAEGLGRIGAGATSAVPALATLSRDTDVRSRVAALEALGRVTGSPDASVPALRQALADAEPAVRAAAASSLGGFRTQAASASAELVRLLKDPDAGVRRSAVYTLGELGVSAPDVLAALTAGLSDPDPSVRRAVESSLARLRGQPLSQRPH